MCLVFIFHNMFCSLRVLVHVISGDSVDPVGDFLVSASVKDYQCLRFFLN